MLKKTCVPIHKYCGNRTQGKVFKLLYSNFFIHQTHLGPGYFQAKAGILYSTVPLNHLLKSSKPSSTLIYHVSSKMNMIYILHKWFTFGLKMLNRLRDRTTLLLLNFKCRELENCGEFAPFPSFRIFCVCRLYVGKVPYSR